MPKCVFGWLGEEVAGNHAAARKVGGRRRTQLESFLKEQPENYFLIGDLALTMTGLGDKDGIGVVRARRCRKSN